MAKQHVKSSDPFAETEANLAEQPEGEVIRQPRTALEQKGVEMFGGAAIGHKGEKFAAKLTNIFDIYPDRLQPRRALPSAIRALWDGNSANLPELFNQWWAAAQEERGESIDLTELLTRLSKQGEDDLDVADQKAGAIESALLAIVELASSIQRDGLINSITITQVNANYYQLETGERRWLAFHLLSHLTQDNQWARIPARIFNALDVWRQASENNARNDLNAIAKARQFALLLMDVYHSQGVEFLPFDQLPHEQAYYAQVADGENFRIPRGMGERFVSAMGLENSVQLRYFRRLLRLPVEAWILADDYNLTEYRLRTIIENASDDAEILHAIHEAASHFGDDTVTTVTVSDDPDEQDTVTTVTVSDMLTRLSNIFDKARLRATKEIAKARKLSDKSQVRSLIASHREWLDDLEKALDD